MDYCHFIESVVVKEEDDNDELEFFWSFSSLEPPKKCIVLLERKIFNHYFLTLQVQDVIKFFQLLPQYKLT